MGRIWTFLKEPQNLAVIVALAGGLGFLWKEVIAPKPAVAPATVAVSAPRQQATANGGVAVSAAGQAQVSDGNTLAPVAGPGQTVSPSTPSVNQDAQADISGTAADCSKFLVPGKQYEFATITTSGPVERGRRQSHLLTAPQTTKEGACTKVTGTYAGSWAMTLKGCGDMLTVHAVRGGDGDLKGEATCSGSAATGTLGYTDAVNQTFGYSVTITRE